MLKRTQLLAKRLYQEIRPIIGKKAIVIGLEGPLGSGKTTFAKAFARAMGITETVLSPTFTLMTEYRILNTEYHLVHIDLWRVDDPRELMALGLDQMIKDKKVIVVEWAEKAKDQILHLSPQAKIIWIKFDYGDKDKERIISWKIL